MYTEANLVACEGGSMDVGSDWQSVASGGSPVGAHSRQLSHMSYSCSSVRGSDSVKSWRVGSYRYRAADAQQCTVVNGHAQK